MTSNLFHAKLLGSYNANAVHSVGNLDMSLDMSASLHAACALELALRRQLIVRRFTRPQFASRQGWPLTCHSWKACAAPAETNIDKAGPKVDDSQRLIDVNADDNGEVLCL